MLIMRPWKITTQATAAFFVSFFNLQSNSLSRTVIWKFSSCLLIFRELQWWQQFAVGRDHYQITVAAPSESIKIRHNRPAECRCWFRQQELQEYTSERTMVYQKTQQLGSTRRNSLCALASSAAVLPWCCTSFYDIGFHCEKLKKWRNVTTARRAALRLEEKHQPCYQLAAAARENSFVYTLISTVNVIVFFILSCTKTWQLSGGLARSILGLTHKCVCYKREQDNRHTTHSSTVII